ncbi:FmdB family zinc ribbon protein [Jeongeupia naejangsanensis]|uniref:Zinc ribbon domain-containing protein n=1 Tax=Jeongeupia naejangsanensis TaxID=613195 RepID=A0ABS2BLC5_9NEIS|nr:zinc ribbon domain-containing protein [Jeongeupia naejangsanensis]MBM3116255.1 zinc ribbon domain-containing protein [Jeongeupia naejangsanensis]
MPIYAYRCSSCGHDGEHMQKMADAALVECPSCHGQTYVKQVTAAGFQLKGSGYYVTDFKNGSSPAPSGGACGSGNCGHAH